MKPALLVIHPMEHLHFLSVQRLFQGQPCSVLPPLCTAPAPWWPHAECGLFSDADDGSANDRDDQDSDADEY